MTFFLELNHIFVHLSKHLTGVQERLLTKRINFKNMRIFQQKFFKTKLTQLKWNISDTPNKD